MPEADWIVLGAHSRGALGYAVSNGRIVAKAVDGSEASVIDELNAGQVPVFRIGDGVPDRVPCAVSTRSKTSLPGINQDRPSGVLGGWTRLAILGFLARNENWDGVICVSEGDITHWVHVSANEVVSFASFLTLRLMAYLGGSALPDPGAINDTQSRPERLASDLRQAEVRGAADAITGHLLGAELAATRVYWLGQQLAIVAPGQVAETYAAAIGTQGVFVESFDVDEMMESGVENLIKTYDNTER